jgi:hypothetical protein
VSLQTNPQMRPKRQRAPLIDDSRALLIEDQLLRNLASTEKFDGHLSPYCSSRSNGFKDGSDK